MKNLLLSIVYLVSIVAFSTPSVNVSPVKIVPPIVFFEGQKCDLANYQIVDADEFTLICEHVTDTNAFFLVLNATDSTFIEFVAPN